MESDRKYRMTRQRQIILDEVMAGKHPSADEIYERVRRRLPQVSMGTVYRNLDTLASLGLIQRLGPAHPQMRFDGNTCEHYHLTCVHCQKIEDTALEHNDDCFINLENALGNLTRFGIFGHRLEFIGICSNCRAEGKTMPDFEDFEDQDNETE